MRRYGHVAVAAALLAGGFVHAAEPVRGPGPAQLTLPPQPAPPAGTQPEQQSILCDLRASPDYVAGIDAKGRDVVPADVPSGQEVEIDTELFVEVRPRDRRLRGTGVIVNLPGLGAPACVPVEDKLRR